MAQPSPFADESDDLDRTMRILPGQAPARGPDAPADPPELRPLRDPPPLPTPLSAPQPDMLRDLPRAAQWDARPAGRMDPRPAVPANGPPDSATWDLGSVNVLCALAGPLLTLAARLSAGHAHPDLEELRRRAIGQVREMEAAALARDIPPERVRVLRYLVCATVDDLVLATPEGPRSEWASRGLVSTIEQETWGGERFFALLDRAMAEPGRAVEVLELCHLCISIGFAGRYRVAPRGAAELAALREEVFRAIRAVRGDPELELSPHWRPLDLPFRPPPATRWLWAAPALAAALLLAVWVAADRALAPRAEALAARLEALLPPGQPLVLRPPPLAPLPAPPAHAAEAPPAAQLVQLLRLRDRLADLVATGRVELSQDEAEIRIRAPGLLLPTGQADPPPEAGALIARIGAALAPEPGRIRVVGHSDNVAVSGRPEANLDLSRRRAEAVAARLAPLAGGAARVAVEGRGPAEPIASNATPAGRERNRRVEILLEREDRGR